MINIFWKKLDGNAYTVAGQFSKNIQNLAKQRAQLFDSFYFYMFLHVGQSIANGEHLRIIC